MLIGYRDLKKRRPKVPQNLQPGGRTNVNMFQNNSAGDSGKQTINRPPGFPGVFHNANLASLPRVSSEPGKLLLRVRIEEQNTQYFSGKQTLF